MDIVVIAAVFIAGGYDNKEVGVIETTGAEVAGAASPGKSIAESVKYDDGLLEADEV